MKMNFSKLPDNRGMIYVPECLGDRKKKPCADCFSCQWCANDRCLVCRQGTPGKKRKNGSRG